MPSPVVARSITAALLLVTLSALSGCGSVEPPPPAPFKGDVDFRTRRIGPVNVPQEGKVAGIDYAVIHYLMWDRRIALVVWMDNDTANHASQGSRPRFQGDDATLDGTFDKLAVKYRTPDGKTGTVNVAGQELDLANGWLVLISNAGGQTRVKQLQRDPLEVQPDAEGGNAKDFEKLRTDPDVVAFFGKK